MYGHILIPLDGSERAESALLVAGPLARKAGGTITTLRVISNKMARTSASAGENEPPGAWRSAMGYLEEVSQRDGLAGLTVNPVVREGVAAEEILAETDRSGADLIVISHRRHSPTTTLLFGGSVADQLMRQARVPVLVLHADNATVLLSVASRPVQALAPLDGTPFSEQAIPPAIELLRALETDRGCALHMTLVIDPKQAYQYDTPETEAMRHARSYLEKIGERLLANPANSGLGITWAVETDPAAVTGIGHVVERATHGHADRFDFIAMASHGREGVSRLLSGSVAETLAHQASMPVLIVHPRH